MPKKGVWENVGFKHHYKYAFTSNIFFYFIKRIIFIYLYGGIQAISRAKNILQSQEKKYKRSD